MKLLFTTIFIISINVSFAQTKQQDIQELITILKIKETTIDIVTTMIKIYQKQKPAVSQQIWNDIKNSVDYNAYMNRIEEIFNANYSQNELQELIKSAVILKPKQPKFKNIVQKQLYNAGKIFGQQLAEAIQMQLKTKGI